MQQQFTTSIFLKIIYVIVSLLFAGFGLFMMFTPGSAGQAMYIWALIPIAFGAIFMALALRRKVVIENGVISVSDVFKTREIAVDNIRGVRFEQKVITIVANDAARTTLTIRNYGEFGNNKDLVAYLQTFTDLNAVDREEEQKNLLENTNLGFTAEERQATLDKAKKISLAYNITGLAVALGYLFTKQPIMAVLAIIYPLLSAVLIFTSKGLIKFLSNKKRSIYPFVFLGFMAPTIALFAKSIGSYQIYSYDNFWLPFVALGVVVAAMLLFTGVDRSLNNSVISQQILMVFMALFYTFGCVNLINCGYDKSPDNIYKAAVIGHHISHGKSTSYYLYLSTWGPCHEQKQVSVSGTMYDDTPVGDSVKIDLKPGLLHIPWFVVRK